MTRVLQIITDSNIGGAGRCLLNYLKYHDASRYDVRVILPRGSALKPEVEALVPVIEADTIAERSFSMEAVRELTGLLRDQKAELVHTHGSLSGRIAARRCGAKIVYTRHSAFPVSPALKHGPGHWLNGMLNSALADEIIAVSPAAEENLLDGGVPPKKITVMMNGVEPLVRATPQATEALRRSLGIPEGCFTAGILARLEPYKGHALLLEAAKSLKAEGRNFRILIAGSGSCEATLREEIQRLDLGDRVLLLGFVEDVAATLSLLDVQLNCSWGTETSSLSILEGMSISLPAIVSSYGGNPCLVEDGVSGLIFENRNADALTDCLRRVLEDPSLTKALGHEARLKYLREFTGERFAANVERVYELALTNHGRGRKR